MANEEFVVYDNQLGEQEGNDPSTEIGGGAIVVHSGTKAKSDSNKTLPDVTISEFNIYPNPFSNTAFIDLQLIESKYISIKVYDLYGRFITNIHDGKIEENRQYNFEFKPNYGLSDGIYIIRIVMDNNRVYTKKMMLVK
jgi:hypothetical protein